MNGSTCLLLLIDGFATRTDFESGGCLLNPRSAFMFNLIACVVMPPTCRLQMWGNPPAGTTTDPETGLTVPYTPDCEVRRSSFSALCLFARCEPVVFPSLFQLWSLGLAAARLGVH